MERELSPHPPPLSPRERETNERCMNKFVLILPNIRSGHNVGAMFRTADGAGVDKIYLSGHTPCPPHVQIDKVSLGAEKWVPWEYCKQTVPILKKLKAAGFNVVALEQIKKSVTISRWKPRYPLALVVGNEKTGVTKNILKYCDEAVSIPMRGRKDSLNVSVAAGIGMYHVANVIARSEVRATWLRRSVATPRRAKQSL